MAVANLQKRQMNALYVPSRREALSTVLGMIPVDVTVVRGDSVTMEQLWVVSELIRRKQKTVVTPYERDADGYQIEREHRRKMSREAFTCDVILTSTNAVSLDGNLVNTDGAGNRVAAMIFGPKKAIVIAGANKIGKDLNEALDRIHNIVAPINAKRHILKHPVEELGNLPCVRTGICVDCYHERGGCRYTIIIEGSGPEFKETDAHSVGGRCTGI